MSKDNIDAIVSSLIVGIACGVFWGSVVAISPTSTASPLAVGLVAFIICWDRVWGVLGQCCSH
nr:MAG TPA: hypothetical protein [Caudoviricetes sp.]